MAKIPSPVASSGLSAQQVTSSPAIRPSIPLSQREWDLTPFLTSPAVRDASVHGQPTVHSIPNTLIPSPLASYLSPQAIEGLKTYLCGSKVSNEAWSPGLSNGPEIWASWKRAWDIWHGHFIEGRNNPNWVRAKYERMKRSLEEGEAGSDYEDVKLDMPALLMNARSVVVENEEDLPEPVAGLRWVVSGEPVKKVRTVKVPIVGSARKVKYKTPLEFKTRRAQMLSVPVLKGDIMTIYDVQEQWEEVEEEKVVPKRPGSTETTTVKVKLKKLLMKDAVEEYLPKTGLQTGEMKRRIIKVPDYKFVDTKKTKVVEEDGVMPGWGDELYAVADDGEDFEEYQDGIEEYVETEWTEVPDSDYKPGRQLKKKEVDPYAPTGGFYPLKARSMYIPPDFEDEELVATRYDDPIQNTVWRPRRVGEKEGEFHLEREVEAVGDYEEKKFEVDGGFDCSGCPLPVLRHKYIYLQEQKDERVFQKHEIWDGTTGTIFNMPTKPVFQEPPPEDLKFEVFDSQVRTERFGWANPDIFPLTIRRARMVDPSTGRGIIPEAQKQHLEGWDLIQMQDEETTARLTSGFPFRQRSVRDIQEDDPWYVTEQEKKNRDEPKRQFPQHYHVFDRPMFPVDDVCWKEELDMDDNFEACYFVTNLHGGTLLVNGLEVKKGCIAGPLPAFAVIETEGGQVSFWWGVGGRDYGEGEPMSLEIEEMHWRTLRQKTGWENVGRLNGEVWEELVADRLKREERGEALVDDEIWEACLMTEKPFEYRQLKEYIDCHTDLFVFDVAGNEPVDLCYETFQITADSDRHADNGDTVDELKYLVREALEVAEQDAREGGEDNILRPDQVWGEAWGRDLRQRDLNPTDPLELDRRFNDYWEQFGVAYVEAQKLYARKKQAEKEARDNAPPPPRVIGGTNSNPFDGIDIQTPTRGIKRKATESPAPGAGPTLPPTRGKKRKASSPPETPNPKRVNIIGPLDIDDIVPSFADQYTDDFSLAPIFMEATGAYLSDKEQKKLEDEIISKELAEEASIQRRLIGKPEKEHAAIRAQAALERKAREDILAKQLKEKNAERTQQGLEPIVPPVDPKVIAIIKDNLAKKQKAKKAAEEKATREKATTPGDAKGRPMEGTWQRHERIKRARAAEKRLALKLEEERLRRVEHKAWLTGEQAQRKVEAEQRAQAATQAKQSVIKRGFGTSEDSGSKARTEASAGGRNDGQESKGDGEKSGRNSGGNSEGRDGGNSGEKIGGKPGSGLPGSGNPNSGQQGSGQQGSGQYGSGQPGSGQPGSGKPDNSKPAGGDTGKPQDPTKPGSSTNEDLALQYMIKISLQEAQRKEQEELDKALKISLSFEKRRQDAKKAMEARAAVANLTPQAYIEKEGYRTIGEYINKNMDPGSSAPPVPDQKKPVQEQILADSRFALRKALNQGIMATATRLGESQIDVVRALGFEGKSVDEYIQQEVDALTLREMPDDKILALPKPPTGATDDVRAAWELQYAETDSKNTENKRVNNLRWKALVEKIVAANEWEAVIANLPDPQGPPQGQKTNRGVTFEF